MNTIDNNSFLHKALPGEKTEEWKIDEDLNYDIKLDRSQVENFLTSFNIDASIAQQYSAQFEGLTGQELIALLDRDDNGILSKNEILGVIDNVSDKKLDNTELDIIFTGEGDNKTLDGDAFRAFVHSLGGFDEEDINQLLEHFLSEGKTADEIIAELTGGDDIVDRDDIENELDNIFDQEE